MARNNRGFAVLSAVAETYERILGWKHELRRYAGVRATTYASDLRVFEGHVVDGDAYAEADLKNGENLTWRIEFRWDGRQWKVSADVSRAYTEGGRPILSLAELSGTDADEFVTALVHTVEALVAADVRSIEPALGEFGPKPSGAEVVREEQI